VRRGKGLKERRRSWVGESGRGSRVKRMGLGGGLEKGKEGVCLLGRDLRGKGVGALKGELN
jgi:hypothetical protein